MKDGRVAKESTGKGWCGGIESLIEYIGQDRMEARKQKRQEKKLRSKQDTGEEKQGRWDNKETSKTGKREEEGEEERADGGDGHDKGGRKTRNQA